MANFTIPGLLGKKIKDKTVEDLKKETMKFLEVQKSLSNQNKLQRQPYIPVNKNLNPSSASSVGNFTGNGSVATGSATGIGHFDEYLKMYEPTKSSKDNWGVGVDDLAKFLKPKKSSFEEILDGLFSLAEREQFLMDIGYVLETKTPDGLLYKDSDIKITRKLADGTIKTITNSLNDLFLKEISVKFKNLLLAKSTLKLKL